MSPGYAVVEKEKIVADADSSQKMVCAHTGFFLFPFRKFSVFLLLLTLNRKNIFCERLHSDYGQ